jgi:hypothetical protein
MRKRIEIETIVQIDLLPPLNTVSPRRVYATRFDKSKLEPIEAAGPIRNKPTYIRGSS